MLDFQFFFLLVVMLIADFIGLNRLKSLDQKKYEQLGKPIHYWTDSNKIEYLVGFIGTFSFFRIKDNKLRIVLFIEAISFWTCIILLFTDIYVRLF
jgi:cell division protein FtsW (lipid II flippase)